MRSALRGGSRLTEEFLIFVPELGAHMVELSSGHGRLQDRGHGPRVLRRLVLA
jgi:hypothetical protein